MANTIKAGEQERSGLPRHIAIILDGNGRWAMKQQHERLFGHQSALTAVRQTVEGGVRLGVKYMTLYTFSTENWNRPQAEVDGLMELLDGWMELNGIENFIRAAGALRDKVRSITIRNGCKGSSQGR